jgi:alkanesulfonate monooxygenase SsuD/methylene tetrahydromethanopterin reductase-like flavin-dependent oxidoreductase (luciferase family)
MKFGLFSHVPWPEGMEQRRILEDTAAEIEYGEGLGFYGAWLAEHHFSRYGLGASSLVLLSNIAGRTRRIRLGTAIVVPTLHHPIRLAEDAATLDVVSGGRLDIGFGRGSANYEYHGYNVDHAESQGRFQDTIRLVEALWTKPDYSYEGQFFTVNRATLVPSPLQQPHPPIYIAATHTPATLEFVVSTGHPLIIGVVLDTAEALALCHRFVQMSSAAGHHVPMSRIPFSRYFYVAETDEQARRDTRAGLEWTMDMLQWRRTFKEGSEVGHQLAEWCKVRTSLPTSYEHLYEQRAIIGTPEACVAKIKALQQAGIDYFICNFAFGGLEHQKVMRSMALFAKEVMPHFS